MEAHIHNSLHNVKKSRNDERPGTKVKGDLGGLPAL